VSRYLQLIFISCHNCALLRFALNPLSPTLLAIWLAWTKLLVLASSVTLGGPDGYSDDAASDCPSLFKRSCLSCCNCSVICSTGRASMISSRTVGSRARTVYVQSSWFCSKRRRRLYHGQHSSNQRLHLPRVASLLFGDSVLAHALPRLGDLAQDILASDVAGTDDAGANGEARAIASEPTTRSSNHRSIEGCSGVFYCDGDWKQSMMVRSGFVPSHRQSHAMTSCCASARSRLVGFSSLTCLDFTRHFPCS